jgi:hypothetical protein
MMSMTDLPWVKSFLNPIMYEYMKDPPTYKLSQVLHSDLLYIFKLAKENDAFDTLGLKKETASALGAGRATIIKSTCSLGEILLVSFKEDPVHPTWNLWWRCIRLLSPKKKVRIVIFGHPKKREVPELGTKIGPAHVNGGSAFRCDPQTIVLYRKEEVTRVLIHELFHASCSDPYHEDTPQIEADTEAWAEMFLCAMAARGRSQPFVRHMREQIHWAVKQASALQAKYRVYSPRDYAWRYLIGRLDVWRRLGLQIPSLSNDLGQVHSLRFTICEPKDV